MTSITSPTGTSSPSSPWVDWILYWPGFLLAGIFALVGAVIAGYMGLSPQAEALLRTPQFGAVLCMVCGVYLLIFTVMGVLTAEVSEEKIRSGISSMLIPLTMVFVLSIFLPVWGGLSPLAHAMLGALRLGASL